MPNRIPPSGSPHSPYCIIGGAPDEVEARIGKPFIGAAGRKLDEILRRAGIARSECYITNVIKERPQKGNIRQFIDLSKKQPEMSKEYLEYEQFLYNELARTDCRMFIPMENVSLWALCRLQTISKWRGSPLLYGERKCIPTYHPASAIYESKKVKKVSGSVIEYIAACDLLRAREYLDKPYPVYNDNFIIRPRYSEALEYLASIRSGSTAAFDIEVMNNQVSCISFAKSPTDAICIPFIDGTDYFDPDQELDIWLEIARILEDPSIQKIGQHLSFDNTFLFRRYGIRAVSCDDTMIAAGILYPDLPKGLDFLTSIYTVRPYYKDEGKKWKTMGSNRESFFIYNALDSATCIEIFPSQLEELKRQGNLETYRRQAAILPVATYMAARGILMDVEKKKAVADSMEEELKQLEAQFIEEVGHPINPRSSDQVIQFFYVELGLKPYTKKNNKGERVLTADADALKRIARKGIVPAQTLLKYKRKFTIWKRYFKMKIDDDNRMRCAINPVGTTTGRFSTSQNIEGTGGNMQNLPRGSDFKRFMIADMEEAIC